MSTRTGGRGKGVKNKVGRQVKENIIAVFNRLGGTAEMAKWAREHTTDFYRMYSSLAPKEVEADVVVHSEVDLTDAELAAIATGRSDGASEAQGGETELTELH